MAMTRGVGALKLAACRHVRGRRDLTLLARVVLEELIDLYNVGRGCAWPSRATLARRLDRSQTQIGAALNELVGAGLIKILKFGLHTTSKHLRNAYSLDLAGLADGGMDYRPDPGAAVLAAATGKPDACHRKTGETTTGKPAPIRLKNKLENSARERAQETRRSAPPPPAVMAGYADRREEEQRQPRRDGTTGGAPVILGDVLAGVQDPKLRAVLSGLQSAVAGSREADHTPYRVMASVVAHTVIATSSVAARPRPI